MANKSQSGWAELKSILVGIRGRFTRTAAFIGDSGLDFVAAPALVGAFGLDQDFGARAEPLARPACLACPSLARYRAEVELVCLDLAQRRVVGERRERAGFPVRARLVVLAAVPASGDLFGARDSFAAALDELQEVPLAAEAQQCGRHGNPCRPGRLGGIAIWRLQGDQRWHPEFSENRLRQWPIR